MGLLARCAAPTLALVAGCYEPELRDCTVACSAETDCASGQVCGTDGMCAAPEIAGQCANRPAVVDGGVGVDGAKPDAKPDASMPPPPDAPAQGKLQVTVEGRGRITVQGIGTCTDDCTYTVPVATQITAEAVALDEWRFDKWTQGPCIGQPATCQFPTTIVVNISAKFRKDD